MRLFGGLLLMLPGFLSDIAGACLLIPFTRNRMKPLLFKWLRGMSKTSGSLSNKNGDLLTGSLFLFGLNSNIGPYFF